MDPNYSRVTQYGPHDPTTAPTSVTVRGREPYAQDRQVPMPQALIEQREAINNLAAVQ